MEANNQVCCHCGRSVAWGSGNYVNRVPVLDDFEVRADIYRHPEGEFVCAECDVCEDQNCDTCEIK